MTYIKENIIIKLQKLNSLPRNPRVGSKSAALSVKKNLFARAIYRPRAKYSLKGLEHAKNLLTQFNCISKSIKTQLNTENYEPATVSKSKIVISKLEFKRGLQYLT